MLHRILFSLSLVLVALLVATPQGAQAQAASPGPTSERLELPSELIIGFGGGYGRNLGAGAMRVSVLHDHHVISVRQTVHGDLVFSGLWMEWGVLYGRAWRSEDRSTTLSAGIAYVDGSNDTDLSYLLDVIVGDEDEFEEYSGLSVPLSLTVRRPLLGPIHIGAHVFANLNPLHQLFGVGVEFAGRIRLSPSR